MAAFQVEPDILIAAEPDSLYVALQQKKQEHKKIIFDCHEWYGEHFNMKIKNALLKEMIRRIVLCWINGMVRRCDAVISVNNTMAQYYAKYNSNSYMIPSIAEMDYRPDANADKKGFVFFGQLGIPEQSSILLNAAKILREQNCSAHIMVIGGSKNLEDFRTRIDEMDISENLSILNWLPREQAFLKLNEGCAGIIRFDMKTFGLPALPNKMFEYMAAGMAVIGSSLNPEIAKIISEEKCGLALADETPEALAEAIRYLHENPAMCRQMGQNALKAVREKYNWDHYGKLLENIMLQVSRK